MDLKSSNTSEFTEPYITTSKSTDFIKPKEEPDNFTPMVPKAEVYKVYKRRWAVLILFAFYSASNSMQWIQFSIIQNIVTKYYGVSDVWIDWTSMVYMILYIPLIFPGSWFLDKMGLRITALVGILGTCIGSWVKVFAVQPHLFFLSFAGQSIVALSQVFILSLPARLAAVWFGPDQVSFACSVGVFGNQLGIAIGFVLPPMLVANSDDLNAIGNDLQWMFNYVAGLTTVLFILIVLFFQAKPPTPPSAAQKVAGPDSEEAENQITFIQSLKNLMTNVNYILLLISYGMNVGVFYAISTLLNPVVLKYYPGHEIDTGRIGLSIVLSGMLGSVVSGIILDKSHKFKETTLGVYAFSMVGMWVFAFTLDTGSIVVVYITASLLGFFMTGYLPVGFEFAAELTFPEPEGTSSGLLNASSQVFGIIFTSMYSWLLSDFNDVVANCTMAIMLIAGTIITAFISSDLRRQNAQINDKQQNP